MKDGLTLKTSFQINWVAFLIAFAVGIMYVYTVNPPQKVVLKYPNPYNAGKIVYRDATNTCFVFDAVKVLCPSDKSKIKQQPIVLP